MVNLAKSVGKIEVKMDGLTPELVEAVREMVDTASDNAYSHDQIIKTEIKIGAATVTMEIGPEPSEPPEPASAPEPWQNVLIHRTAGVLTALIIAIAVYSLFGGNL